MMKRASLLCVSTTMAMVLSGCISVPSETDPQAIRSFEQEQPSSFQGPKEGEAPDLLLRDFYSANALAEQQYRAAKSYMSKEKAESWAPKPDILVLDRIDVNSAPQDDEEPGRTYEVTGTIVGEVSKAGAYQPRKTPFRQNIRLEEIDGEWRIVDLPNQIVVERNAFRNHYTMRNVYFFDPSGSRLVADQRWIYNRTGSLDSALLSLLIEGPSEWLAPGVMDELPADATYAGRRDGVYEFSGLTNLSSDAMRRLAASIVWTLGMAEIGGPYHLAFDGNAVRSRDTEDPDLTVDNFAEYNPQATGNSFDTAYALIGGQLVNINGGKINPVTKPIGQLEDIESISISGKSDAVGAVRSSGQEEDRESELLIGTMNTTMESKLRARTLTKPTFEPTASSLWTVIDGQKIARVARSSDNGEIVQTEVDSESLGEHSDISVLQLSHAGSRAAMVMDGKVYVGVVARPNVGERKLTNVIDLLPGFEDTIISLDWQADGTLLIGTANPEAPVWVVAPDGSSATPLPGANLDAPVVSVTSNSSTIFATDARATMQIPKDLEEANFWREVAGLEGVRAPVVVPN
ncbi:MtrAB system accessory lipoprotein LpqB [Corynebacterium pseudopelargi]|uniref:Lipoprotein LpqB n=1 Tax=Corynebacterium pseudopelargi TaxID=2080757 RepID=A0A3G6IVL6_9CORY|nr:MtrAB system accessory lipoprotein LpqB [Corynebacterium pseudopelargi]AZA09821.1 Lipoprotein LpqB precursor [Corynebacterium pseudopelargi]